MHIIPKTVLLYQCRNLLIPQSVRSAHWNKDWMPGPYPLTPEERAAAAKKYGLFPEEYEPYPDDGLGRGDYPKLENISAESRDPYYPYDFPEHRKNFGEVMHANSDINGEDRCDFNIDSKLRVTKMRMVLWFVGVVGTFVGLTYLGKDRVMVSRPVLARQYPAEGVVHYKY